MSESVSKQRILEVLGADIEDHLEILKLVKEGKSCWVLKPKRYLGSDTFADIIKKVKVLGGEYVSAGKESHFKIPMETKGSKPSNENTEIIKRLIAGIRENCDRIEAHLE